MFSKKKKYHIFIILTAILLALTVAGCSQAEIDEPSETTPAPTQTSTTETASQTTTATPPTTETQTETTTETSEPPETNEPAPEEDDHIITVDGTDYFVTSEYNTTAIGCYDEDNFLERFSEAYLDVEIVPGKTVIGGSTVYDNGTEVYITARDGSWTYGPATIRNHHTGYGNSTLQLYFGSEEELAEFEAVNLSGCTVYEITTPKYAEPKTMEIDGEEYYVLDTLTGNMRTTSGSVDYGPTRPKLPDYGIYADPELIPEGSIVYVEGLGTTPWSYGPITTVVNVPNLGNYIEIMISDDGEREALSDIHIYDSDNCTIRIISPEKPEAENVPSQTQVSTYEYTGYNAQLPSEPPEYDNDVEIFLPPCSSPELYGYNGYGIEDLIFSYVPFDETSEKLKEFFCESALTPADEKDPGFTPDFYIDFNNGFVVAVWEESNYCEAAYYEYAGNASFRNHLFNESHADALSLRGKPYTFDEEVLELVAEIIEEATPDPEDFPEVPEFTAPEAGALPVELDENWSSVSSVTFAYPLYYWSNVREGYPVNYDFGTPCVTYTITDPEIVRQLIYCFHPDNLKPDVSTYRSPPEAALCFDNGYQVRFYVQYEYGFVAPCLYIGNGTYGVTLEAERYFSELFMTIE